MQKPRGEGQHECLGNPGRGWRELVRAASRKDPSSGSGVNGLQGTGLGACETREEPGVLLQEEEDDQSGAGGESRV